VELLMFKTPLSAEYNLTLYLTSLAFPKVLANKRRRRRKEMKKKE
jgi:hypothetical protein